MSICIRCFSLVGLCQEKVKRFVFIKIEKTGSSTLYNIFSRFVHRYQLNLMTAPRENLYHLDFTAPKGACPGRHRHTSQVCLGAS